MAHFLVWAPGASIVAEYFHYYQFILGKERCNLRLGARHRRKLSPYTHPENFRPLGSGLFASYENIYMKIWGTGTGSPKLNKITSLYLKTGCGMSP